MQKQEYKELTFDDRRFTYNIVSQLVTEYEKNEIVVSEKEEQAAIVRTISHMRKYVEEYRVFINSIDIYKVVSWFAFELHKVASCPKKDHIILATVHILNRLLNVDTESNYMHTEDFVTKICMMALNDKHLAGNEDLDYLAIGQNGFYLSFKSPSMMYLKQDSALENLA